MSVGNTVSITLHYTDMIVYICQEVILYLSPYTTLTRLYTHVRIQYFIDHLTLHRQGCIYMSVGNTVLSLYTTLT